MKTALIIAAATIAFILAMPRHPSPEVVIAEYNAKRRYVNQMMKPITDDYCRWRPRQCVLDDDR